MKAYLMFALNLSKMTHNFKLMITWKKLIEAIK